MRHLFSLGAFEPWEEDAGERTDWGGWVEEVRESGLLDDDEEEEEDGEEAGEEDPKEWLSTQGR